MKEQRKHNRLKYHDYSDNGLYFITMCTRNRINYLAEIIEYGRNHFTTIS